MNGFERAADFLDAEAKERANVPALWPYPKLRIVHAYRTTKAPFMYVEGEKFTLPALLAMCGIVNHETREVTTDGMNLLRAVRDFESTASAPDVPVTLGSLFRATGEAEAYEKIILHHRKDACRRWLVACADAKEEYAPLTHETYTALVDRIVVSYDVLRGLLDHDLPPPMWFFLRFPASWSVKMVIPDRSLCVVNKKCVKTT